MIFAWILPNLQEKNQENEKKGLHIIFGDIFSNQSKLGAIYRDFLKVFRDFAQNSTDFARFFTKLKLLGLRLHPCTPASYTSDYASVSQHCLFNCTYSHMQ